MTLSVLVILSNIQNLQYQVILVLKQPKFGTNKIPWTVSRLEHLSATMPAACYATKHIVHDIDPCGGVCNLFGLDMTAAAQVHLI